MTEDTILVKFQKNKLKFKKSNSTNMKHLISANNYHPIKIFTFSDRKYDSNLTPEKIGPYGSKFIWHFGT